MGCCAAKKLRCVDKAEDRAVTVAELEEVVETLRARCTKEAWRDFATDEVLQPEAVNLYQLHHYLICPDTVPKGVELRGLSAQRFRKGQCVTQLEKFGGLRKVSQGIVQKCSRIGVYIKLCEGQFRAGNEVAVDDQPAGTLTDVICEDSLSYKELLSGQPLRPTWLVSHWWGEPVLDFVKCCAHHAKFRDLEGPQASYWICAYANRQHDLDQDLAENPEDTSFNAAMNASLGVLLILDPTARPFTRIWCAFELHKTIRNPEKILDISTVHDGSPRLLSQGALPGESSWEKKRREMAFPLEIMADGLSKKLEDADATFEIDKIRILNCLAGRSKSSPDLNDRDVVDRLNDRKNPDNILYSKVNNSLHSRLAVAAWPQAMKRGILRDFDVGRPGQVSLLGVLQRDTEMTDLQMDLQTFDEVTDKEIQSLAKALPKSLATLELSLGMCENVTSEGVKSIVRHLPQSLRRLKLRLAKCTKVSDPALQALGSSWPRALEELDLSFQNCRGVTDTGGEALVKSLPTALRELTLNLQGCEVSDSTLVLLAGGLPLSLEALKLDVTGCRSVSDIGVKEIAQKLPEKISILHVVARNSAAGRSFESVDEMMSWMQERWPDRPPTSSRGSRGSRPMLG